MEYTRASARATPPGLFWNFQQDFVVPLSLRDSMYPVLGEKKIVNENCLYMMSRERQLSTEDRNVIRTKELEFKFDRNKNTESIIREKT